eukprot:Sdes_comp20505_c0_seq1m14989
MRSPLLISRIGRIGWKEGVFSEKACIQTTRCCNYSSKNDESSRGNKKSPQADPIAPSKAFGLGKSWSENGRQNRWSNSANSSKENHAPAAIVAGNPRSKMQLRHVPAHDFSAADIGCSFFQYTEEDLKLVRLFPISSSIEKHLQIPAVNQTPSLLIRSPAANILDMIGVTSAGCLQKAKHHFAALMLHKPEDVSHQQKIISHLLDRHQIRLTPAGDLPLSQQKIARRAVDFYEQHVAQVAKADFCNPHKFLLVGNRGYGKTMQLFHVVLACAKRWGDDCILIYISNSRYFTEIFQMISKSHQFEHNGGLYDLSYDAKKLLHDFLQVNQKTIVKHDLRTTQDYIKYPYHQDPPADQKPDQKPPPPKGYFVDHRIGIKKGTPLIKLLEAGAKNRTLADDFVGIVFREVMKASLEGPLKVVVCVDDIHRYFSHDSILAYDADSKKIPNRKIKLIHFLFEYFLDNTNEWNTSKNLYVVGSADVKEVAHLDRNLLKRECKLNAADPAERLGKFNDITKESDYFIPSKGFDLRDSIQTEAYNHKMTHLPWLYEDRYSKWPSLCRLFGIHESNPEKSHPFSYTVLDMHPYSNLEIVSVLRYYHSLGFFPTMTSQDVLLLSSRQWASHLKSFDAPAPDLAVEKPAAIHADQISDQQ